MNNKNIFVASKTTVIFPNYKEKLEFDQYFIIHISESEPIAIRLNFIKLNSICAIYQSS